MKTVVSARAAFVVLSLLTFGLSLASGQMTNACVSPLDSEDYTKFTIAEFAEYGQTNADGTVPFASNSFYFEAAIGLATNMSASAAMVTIPNSGPQTMRMTDSHHFAYIASTNSFSNLTAAFPDGVYDFIISNNSTAVSLPEFTTLPNAPTLSNYAAAQAIDATKDFTLSWVPFSGGSAKDYIDVQLSGEFGLVFKSGEFLCPISLDGTASSVLIPANTLATNQTYEVEIDFVKVLLLDTNSMPGDALLVGTEAVTITSVSTSPGQITPLVLANAALLPGGGIQFDLATTPGVTYSIQFNENLSNPAGWTSLIVTNAASSSVTFTNTPPTSNAGFYRVVQD